MKNRRNIIVVGLLVAVGTLLGLLTLIRPRVLSSEAPLTEFSAERAMDHVTAVSKASHPPGSEELAKVRGYIISQLHAMGLHPEVLSSSIAVSMSSPSSMPSSLSVSSSKIWV